MSRSGKFALLALLCLAPSLASAQEAVLDDFYGRGVQAYYSGDYRTAFTYLSAAITAGSTDPRAYYFRGLTELNLGCAPDAKADFTCAVLSWKCRQPGVLRRGPKSRTRAGANSRDAGKLSLGCGLPRQRPASTDAWSADETARPVMPPPAAAAPPAEAKEPAKRAAADNPFGDAAGAKEAAPPAEKKPDDNPFGS